MSNPSPVVYRTILSSEDQANVHRDDAGAGGDQHEYTLTTAQTEWTYFLLGCAVLLPFSALFNATSFFLSRLSGSSFYSTFGSYFSSVYTWTKLVCQFYCTVTSKRSSPSRRTFASIMAMILLITALCFSTFIRATPSSFFAFALFSAALMAVAASHLVTAVYAMAAVLGAPFLQSVLSGQATITVAVSAVQVASSIIALRSSSLKPFAIDPTRAVDKDGRAEEMAARIFFGVSAVFLCIVLVAFTWLTRQSFHKSITAALEQHRHRVRVPDERAELLVNDRGNRWTETNSHIYRVFRQNFIFLFSIAYVFAVTLAVYPSITARVRPMDPEIHPLLFTAIHFLVTNIGGFVGQRSCSCPRLIVWSGKKILAMSLLRTLFIPLVLLCNVDRPATTLGTPIIHSDIIFMIIMFTIGYTTGYVSTLGLLAVSSLEHNPGLMERREDVDIAATLGGSCMILGLALGSLSSFGVQGMI